MLPASFSSSQALPKRANVVGVRRDGQIFSRPSSRSGAKPRNPITYTDDGGTVGGTADYDEKSARLQKLISQKSFNTSTSASSANIEALTTAKNGVLGCVNGGGKPMAGQPGCQTCSTVDCLTDLLTGNLLDIDAKKLLCDMVSSAERAAKNSLDQAGNGLLNAAEALTSANVLKAPLNTLDRFINKLDPGAVANCFGAQAVKDQVRGKLKDVNRAISKAERGLHKGMAEKFNKATQAVQQFSVTPDACGKKR